MAPSNELNPVECPKCHATRSNVRFVFLMETQCHIEEKSSVELVVDSGHVAEPPGGSKPLLLCTKCSTRWPLPKGITVLMDANGQKKTVFGPDGLSR